MGSPEFAVRSLDALVDSGRYRPALVVSQPDRPRGRGRAVTPTPVRARALDLGIPTLTMDRTGYAPGVARIAEETPELIAVVAFGVILRADLLAMPPRGCINVHASLLPRHRGVAPIQAAILAGDAVTGCTTMRIDEGVDTGAMLLREEIPIRADDTAGTLSARLADVGARLLVRTFDGLVDGSVTPVAQDPALATTTRKIKKRDGAVDWTQDAASVARRVRAMTPWPGAFTEHRGARLIIARVVERAGATPAPPGRVIGVKPLVVACGRGAVEIAELRPEGRRAMTPAEYAAGHPLEAGDVFGSTGAH
jgi:methionyl-tRNA formyltransferase